MPILFASVPVSARQHPGVRQPSGTVAGRGHGHVGEKRWRATAVQDARATDSRFHFSDL